MSKSQNRNCEGRTYNTVIVGGGIVGAGLFRDLSLHGVSTLLIDKHDFCSQTSSASSKMLHGGIRYLENLDFALVHEALREKNLWLKLAPHLAYEDAFIVPSFKESKVPLWQLGLGLLLYDFLSQFKNSPFKILSKNKTLDYLKGLQTNTLKGAGLYHDAVVDDLLLGLENIYDGLLEEKSQAFNHMELVSVDYSNKPILLELFDRLTEKSYFIECENLVFATGPFTDQLLKNFPQITWKPTILPSKGGHLWIHKDSLEITSPMVLETVDQRIIFVIPYSHAILVGTTEVLLEPNEDYFDLKISQNETDYLLKNLNEYFPTSHISEKNILASFSGVRPLVREDGESDMNKTTREHKVFRPQKNTHVILGGKYTTFRTMVQETAASIVQTNNRSYCSNKTLRPLRQRSTVLPFQPREEISTSMLENILKHECPKNLDDLLKRRLKVPKKDLWPYSIPIDQFLNDNMELINQYFPLNSNEINTFS
jgi:glycerol-3-phosphate dehydrogenase